jgi:hypothetical protein
MAAHGVSHAQCAVYVQGFRDGDDVASEIAPSIGRRRFSAAAVAADLDGDAAAIRELARDLIPGAAMEACGVSEEDGRGGVGVSRGPLPRRDFDAIGIYEVELRLI